MMKFSIPLILFFCFIVVNGYAQDKTERRHRIKKSQFPSEAVNLISRNNTALKRLKYYREVDTTQKTYTATFKKARLFYEMNFDQKGEFKSMGFGIKQIDIPEESLQHIMDYLSQKFDKATIQHMVQLYPRNDSERVENIIKSAFQNLLTETLRYRLKVKGKKVGKSSHHIIIFDANGHFIEIKKPLPANYDRVLY